MRRVRVKPLSDGRKGPGTQPGRPFRGYEVAVSLHTWFIFLAATVAICIAPGPDMLFVVASAARGGARAGLDAVRGITTAMALHVTAAALGLSALFAASASAFNVLRIVGAVYLVWLGINALWGARGKAKPAPPRREAFRRGFLTNVTNPKVIVFFAAFLPQFIVPGGAPVAVQLLELGLVFAGVGLAFDIAIAFTAGTFGKRLVSDARAARVLDGVAGAVMIALGVELFGERHPA
jgi:threonine/homoserine/homoserine lactone efflux protein